jgi:tetratricopeptide (TPR) repeat protein
MPCRRTSSRSLAKSFFTIAGCLLIVQLLIHADAFGAESSKQMPVLAVVGIVSNPDVQSDASLTSSFVALLEADLSQEPDVTLVERMQRDNILREMNVNLSGLADEHAALQIGKMLGADLIVWGEAARVGAGPALVFHVVESQTGIIRGICVAPLGNQNVQETVGDAARQIVRVAMSSKPATATVAVGIFENAGQFQRLRPLALLLRDGMTDELVRRPELMVLQRSSMQPLIDELDLIRSGLTAAMIDTLPSRQATYLLQGHFSDVIGSDPPRVKAGMELLSAATGAKVLSDERELAVSKLDQLYPKWAELIDKTVGVVSPGAAANSGARLDEFEILKRTGIEDLAQIQEAVKVPSAPTAQNPWWDKTRADQPIHASFRREAIDKLEGAVFLRPDDPLIKALLASAYAVPEKGAMDDERVIDLYHDVYLSAPGSVLGIHALRQMAVVYFRKYSDEGHHIEDLRSSADTYKLLGDQLRAGDIKGFMRATEDAARWYAFAPLNDFDQAISAASINVDLAETFAPNQRPPDTFVVQDTASTLMDIAYDAPQRADECRALLKKWSASPSAYLRYVGLFYLGRLAEYTKDFSVAGDTFSAAAEVCVGEEDNWFKSREEAARGEGSFSYSKGGDLSAAWVVLKPLAKRMYSEPNVAMETYSALADIYTAAGREDKVFDLLQRYHELNPGYDPFETRYNELLRKRDKTGGRGNGVVDYKIHLKGDIQLICEGGGRIWTTESDQINWFDPKEESGSALHLKNLPKQIEKLAWNDGCLWMGTSGEGLWRLDAHGPPGDWEDEDRCTQVKGLPDQNITALAPGDGGDLYVGVGVIGRHSVEVKGGLIRIDSRGTIHVIDQPGGSKLAPNQILWRDKTLWVSDVSGVHYLDFKDAQWKFATPTSRQVRISAGMENRLILLDTTWRPYAAYSFSPASKTPELCLIACPGDLLIGASLETPKYYWFSGQVMGSGARQLQCLEKESGKMMMLDEQAGKPFSSVRSIAWIDGKLWVATGEGLVTIDAVHFPASVLRGSAIRQVPP